MYMYIYISFLSGHKEFHGCPRYFLILSSFKLDKSYDLIPCNRKRYPDMDAFLKMLPFSGMASINKELEMASFRKSRILL